VPGRAEDVVVSVDSDALLTAGQQALKAGEWSAARSSFEAALELEEPYRLVEYTSEQRGLPAARHWRHFEETDDELEYRITVEYQPRPGWRGLVDRLLVRRAVERTLREMLANLERRFRERSSRARLSDTRG
jgi:hypothetical protein